MLGLHPSPHPIHTCATLSTAEGLVTHRCSRVSQLYYGLSNPPSLIERAGHNINPALPLCNKTLFQLAWWSTWPDDDSHSQMCNLPSGSLLVWTHCLYTLIFKTATDRRKIPVWLYKDSMLLTIGKPCPWHLLLAELVFSTVHSCLQWSYMEEDNCKWH